MYELSLSTKTKRPSPAHLRLGLGLLKRGTSKLASPVATYLLLFITEIYIYNYDCSEKLVIEFILTIPILLRSYIGISRKREGLMWAFIIGYEIVINNDIIQCLDLSILLLDNKLF